jgi:hypothetical protein
MSHRIAGIDPGSQSGVVIVELPARSRVINLAAWVGSFLVHGMSETMRRSRAEGQAALFDRVRDVLRANGVREVVIEWPIDALPVWGGASRVKGRTSSPATLFSIGMSYGICVAAARSVASVQRIESYRVKPTREHAGWMPLVTRPQRSNPNKRVTHVMPRDELLGRLRSELSMYKPRLRGGMLIGETPNVRALSEDELMAYGVLKYHLSRTPTPPPPTREKLATRGARNPTL